MEGCLEGIIISFNPDVKKKTTGNYSHASFHCGVSLQSILSQCSVGHTQLLWTHKGSCSLQLTPSTSRWCVFLNRESCLKGNIQVDSLLRNIALLHTYIVYIHILICICDIVSIILRLLPAPSPCHNVCTEFLLPACGSGADHQMWDPGNPLHADEQQLCIDEPGLVCSHRIWNCANRWSC